MCFRHSPSRQATIARLPTICLIRTGSPGRNHVTFRYRNLRKTFYIGPLESMGAFAYFIDPAE